LLDETLPILPLTLTVAPAPTSPRRRRVRGFDHTALVAKQLAKLRALPYRQVLAKENNSIQHFKTRKERLRSAKDGLRIRGTVPREVLLVEDIYTTGATIQACAEVLREAGAESVYVALIARQVPENEK
jgi:ComF family protein